MRADGAVDVSGCPGVALHSDGVLDVNLRSVAVRGRVTLNGAPLPDAGRPRGSVEFVARRGAGRTAVALGSTGPAQYDVSLAPGRYDVLYVADPAQCAQASGGLPCNGGPLMRDVALDGPGQLDLNLTTAQVQGSVTVNGAAVPAAYRMTGGLRFRLKDGNAYDTSGRSGLSDYRLVLLRGSYDVELVAPTSCAAASPLPCVSGTLKAGIDLSSDGSLVLDIPTAKVTGGFTINTAPVAAGAAGLGAARFHLTGGGSVATNATAPMNGLAPYQLTLLRGTYDIWFQSQNGDCTAGVPCIDGRLKRAVAIASDGRLDLDVPAISVEGTVTINGQPVKEALEQGSLLFRNADESSVLTRDKGPRKLGAYRLTLLPGPYTIEYVAGPTCDAGAQGPCGGGLLRGDVSLASSGVLNVDIPAVQVTGRTLLVGGAVPSAAIALGRLVFQRRGAGPKGGSAQTADLRPFSVRLLPGEYDVRYEYQSSACPPDALVPCVGGVLLSGQRLMLSGALDVNVPLVRVRGRVTLNQQPLPSLSNTRGRLQFVLSDASALTSSFNATGPVSYSIALLPGRYVIAHANDINRCSGDTGTFPCIGQLVAGCD